MAKANSNYKPKIMAAIPAYNEGKYIGTVVLKTKQYVDEVIVVDDGSTDDTSQIAKLAGANVIQHKENKGYGAAVRSLLSEARRNNPDILILLDADTQHNPDEIPRLIKPIISQGSDLVVGSRKQQKVKIPPYRRFGLNVLSYFSGILSREKLADSESGFRVFSRKAITVLQPRENGMAISAETIADATAKGLKVTEVPISIAYTKDGSTLNPVRHGFGVLYRILAMISERRPLFFFGLGGSILVIFGLIAGVRTLYLFSNQGILPPGNALLAVLFLSIGIFSIFTGIILHTLASRKRPI